MALREEFERWGNWFFRWRSYLPLLLAFLFLIALKTVDLPLYPEASDRAWELFALLILHNCSDFFFFFRLLLLRL